MRGPSGTIGPLTIAQPISPPIIVSGKPCVPSLPPPAELLRALSATLAELNAGWYVFGAQAVLHWGRPRFTEDIDVTVLLGTVETSRLVTRLREAGQGSCGFDSHPRHFLLNCSEFGPFQATDRPSARLRCLIGAVR